MLVLPMQTRQRERNTMYCVRWKPLLPGLFFPKTVLVQKNIVESVYRGHGYSE